MKDLKRILHDLEQGNINSDEAEKRVLRLFNVINRYSIEDIEKCVENWGLCKVEKEYIERFLNG